MNAEQKQRALQMLRRFEQAAPMSLQVDNAAVDMAALLHELIDAPEPEPVGEAVDFNGWGIVRWKGEESSFPLGTKFYTAPPAPSVPVLTVKCEPDYWSGGHYHEGTMPHIDPTAVWNLPIGTELYTSPPAPIVPDEFYNAVTNLSVELDARHGALSRFAALVAAAEREACAKVCDAIHADKWALYKGRPPYTGAEAGRADNAVQGMADGADMCAAAIRARGNQ